MSGALTHMMNNLRCKARGYICMEDCTTAKEFKAVERMIRCKHLKTLTQVYEELRRRNLNDK